MSGGQYSLVNNVRGDIIHGGTLFTPTPDYMMDRVAEADKENDIATACQENQERGVVGVTVR